ncbi:UNVERIFIED_CONTAM: hypothetical protein NCL1_58999, partial [Trichonephila clavipes]
IEQHLLQLVGGARYRAQAGFEVAFDLQGLEVEAVGQVEVVAGDLQRLVDQCRQLAGRQLAITAPAETEHVADDLGGALPGVLDAVEQAGDFPCIHVVLDGLQADAGLLGPLDLQQPAWPAAGRTGRGERHLARPAGGQRCAAPVPAPPVRPWRRTGDARLPGPAAGGSGAPGSGDRPLERGSRPTAELHPPRRLAPDRPGPRLPQLRPQQRTPLPAPQRRGATARRRPGLRQPTVRPAVRRCAPDRQAPGRRRGPVAGCGKALNRVYRAASGQNARIPATPCAPTCQARSMSLGPTPPSR